MLDGLIDKLPQMSTCCFCCRVETGSRVIAWINFVSTLLGMVTTVLAGAAIAMALNKPEHHKPDNPDAETYLMISLVIMGFLLLLLALALILSVILLMGIYKGQMEKVRLWLKISLVLYMLAIIGGIINIIRACASGLGAGIIIYEIVSIIVQLVVSYYFLGVVKSFYYEKTQGYGPQAPA